MLYHVRELNDLSRSSQLHHMSPMDLTCQLGFDVFDKSRSYHLLQGLHERLDRGDLHLHGLGTYIICSILLEYCENKHYESDHSSPNDSSYLQDNEVHEERTNDEHEDLHGPLINVQGI